MHLKHSMKSELVPLCTLAWQKLPALRRSQPGRSDAAQLSLHHQAGGAPASCRSQRGMARHPLPPGGARCPMPTRACAASWTPHMSPICRIMGGVCVKSPFCHRPGERSGLGCAAELRAAMAEAIRNPWGPPQLDSTGPQMPFCRALRACVG